MELVGIIAGVLLVVGGLVVLAGAGWHAWAAGRQDLAGKTARTAGELRGPLAGPQRGCQEPGLGTGGHALALTLILAWPLSRWPAVALGALVDNVTDGDGVAVVDHPVARLSPGTGHRS